jgi:MFS family permease
VPSSLVDSFSGLIALRFLQGFFGSPCLATGGATLQDIYSLLNLPYVLSLWAFVLEHRHLGSNTLCPHSLLCTYTYIV